MADVTPKVKILTFLSIIALLISVILNLSISVVIENKEFNMANAGLGVLPFVNVVRSFDIPDDNIRNIFIIFTTFISVIQTFMIAVIVVSFISNILWHPDV
jgi:hypothetical protein